MRELGEKTKVFGQRGSVQSVSLALVRLAGCDVDLGGGCSTDNSGRFRLR